MAQQNIDFGSFPNDPSADSIQTAFQKANTNFSQLFAASTSTAVTSINRTPGAGITVNQSTGNVVLSASIACVQVATSSLSIGRNGNGGTSASITQSSSQTLVIDINPDSVRSNSFSSVGDGLAIFNGTLSANSNAQPNVTSLGNLLVANVTGNLIAGNISANANIDANAITANYITSNSFVIKSVGTTITATGSTQGTATPLDKSVNVISSAATGTGVVLPTATAGMSIYITNSSANTVKVYPASGASINTGATNASVDLSSNVTVQLIAPTATQWFSVSNLS
jgi:hypothetical protein